MILPKCFIDSTAVEANTDRPTDSTHHGQIDRSHLRRRAATCTGWVCRT